MTRFQFVISQMTVSVIMFGMMVVCKTMSETQSGGPHFLTMEWIFYFLGMASSGSATMNCKIDPEE